MKAKPCSHPYCGKKPEVVWKDVPGSPVFWQVMCLDRPNFTHAVSGPRAPSRKQAIELWNKAEHP